MKTLSFKSLHMRYILRLIKVHLSVIYPHSNPSASLAHAITGKANVWNLFLPTPWYGYAAPIILNIHYIFKY